MAPNLMPPLNASERQKLTFSSYVEEQNGCLVWNGAKTKKGDEGYAIYGVKGEPTFLLHRRLWIEANGPLSREEHLDHLCRVRACINIDHLEVVTVRQNVVERGMGITAVNAVKEVCDHGHKFSAENTYVWTGANGGRHRICRECVRRNKHDYRARLKAAAQ
jgi:HNH endonuclease